MEEIKTDHLPTEDLKLALILKRNKMGKETWVRNVLKVYPEKTRKETEALWEKLQPLR